MPWIKALSGPIGADHSFFTFYWTVSPGWGWLLLRAGVGGAAVLFVGLYRPNWYVFHWLWTGDFTPKERIWERVATFTVAIVVLVGIFAGTDRQAAHDHPTGPSQCFSSGIPDKTGRATGELDKSDALYFTVGNLTTAGTGSVAPISSSCRAMTAIQIVWVPEIRFSSTLTGVGL
jgi:hypothetical protein